MKQSGAYTREFAEFVASKCDSMEAWVDVCQDSSGV